LIMRTNELIKEIQRLPISKRIFVLENAMHDIRMFEDKKMMKNAAHALCFDYKTDVELTEFSKIDFEDFFETKCGLDYKS